MARGYNRHVDSLATLASSSTEGIPRLIKVELVAKPSISVGVRVSKMATVKLCWMDPIINFLAEDRVPADEKERKRYARQLLGIGCLPTANCIEYLLTSLTCSAYPLARPRNSLSSYMMVYAAVTWGDVR